MSSQDSDSPPVEEQVSPEDVVDLFDELEIPFVTSKMVAREYNCTGQTARNKLSILVDNGDLERIDLGGRQAVWFQSDYEAATEIADQLREYLDLTELNTEHLAAFARQPYKLLPKDENEYYVIVPRFVPFSVGHLREQDDAWQTFIINKYVNWIEDIPDLIRDKIDLGRRYDHALVEDGILELSDQEERDRAWRDLGGEDGGLHERVDDNKIKIQRGKEFDIIAKLIENGNLPFAAQPTDESELREEPENIELRPYQRRAWEKFRETGQVGVYWPPGLGKTFFGLYAGERIDGNKLVVVPSSTLEAQWERRIREHCDKSWKWEVRTYQYLTREGNLQDYQGEDSPKLTIFDECHTLPADTYSSLSTLDTDYRIGCSATPYREDARTDYIFALTGIPVGIDWREMLEYGDLEFPEVDVFLYQTEEDKREDIVQLVDEGVGETLIFCDGIEAGKALSDKLDVPFVYGDTPKEERMEIFEENRVVIGSRVADEGVSLENLDRVIEYQFHGSSRRQELQRAGRVMHGSDVGEHIVQMTDQEYEKFSQRLYSLEEKGMDIRLERRA